MLTLIRSDDLYINPFERLTYPMLGHLDCQTLWIQTVSEKVLAEPPIVIIPRFHFVRSFGWIHGDRMYNPIEITSYN